jgi:hypothetical protein
MPTIEYIASAKENGMKQAYRILASVKAGTTLVLNALEKANDLLVSNRQKHHGMSWCADGSASLATLTSVHRDDEYMHWLLHRDIRFTFPQPAAKPAA